MPAKYQAKLRYSTTFTLSPTGTTVAQRVFSANGMYDPDQTGIGHQPRGFDQIMSMYSHFTVVKCQMRAMFDHQDAAGSYPFIFGIFEDANSGVTPDSEDVMEKSKIVSYLHTRDATRSQAKFTSYPNRRLGLNNPGNLQLSQLGSSSGNPTDQVYLKAFAYYPVSQVSPTF